MNRKKKKLLYIRELKQGIEITVKSNKGWRRGVVTRLNENGTVQVDLGNWNYLIRCKQNDIYYLEDQFKRMSWQAIPCGLAYAGPTHHTWQNVVPKD